MTIFEKTMQACLADNTTSKKKVVEKKTVKKDTKKVTEKKLSRKVEADEDNLDELDDIGDAPADEEPTDEFAEDFGDEFAEDDTAEDVEDGLEINPDFEDDIDTVTDPEMDDDDNFLADALKYFQDANEETLEVAEDAVEEAEEEGEEPSTEDYVGKNVYICPICGSSFFNDGEMEEGDACPICGEVPDAFVSCGIVESTDDAEETADEEEVAEDVEETEEDIEDVAEDLENIELDEEDVEEDKEDEEEEEDEEDEDEDEDKAKEEAYRRRRAAMRRRNEARRRNENKSRKTEGPLLGASINLIQKFADKCEARGIKEAEAKKLLNKYIEENGFTAGKIDKFLDANCKSCAKKESKRVEKKAPEFLMNEKTFERHLCKFYGENYSNVDDVTVKSARFDGNSLVIETRLTYKSGKKKTVPMKVECFNMKTGVYKVSDTKNAFEAKCANAPFRFAIVVENNIVKCKGISYKYETKSEGRRVLVSGTTKLTESKKKVKTEAPKKVVKANNTEDIITDKKVDANNGFTDDLERNKLAKLGIIRDTYLYDVEMDAPDGEERMEAAIDKYGEDEAPKYVRPNADDKKRAKEMGKIIGMRRSKELAKVTGKKGNTAAGFEHNDGDKADQVKAERPDIYDAIMACKDNKELNALTRKYLNAAYDGDFKAKF